jgi:hypothetical protein
VGKGKPAGGNRRAVFFMFSRSDFTAPPVSSVCEASAWEMWPLSLGEPLYSLVTNPDPLSDSIVKFAFAASLLCVLSNQFRCDRL